MFRHLVFLASLSVAASGCASSHLVAPDGFAHVGGEYDDRVASANGVVIGTRVVKNDPKANLDFWAQAIDLRLRSRGYEPTEQPQDVKSTSGLEGRALRYVYFDGTYKNRYFVDVYMSGGRILLVEAAGTVTDFDAAGPAVIATMRSARL